MTDVIVIGGGPSGLMAAVAAAENGASVMLVDKGKKLGRKLAISGGGRCNVTNRAEAEELIRHIPGNGRFMYSPFSVFNNEDIITFFEGLGIKLKEEDRGRMFPVNDKAVEVVRVLLNRIQTLNVDIRKSTEVSELLFDQEAKKVTGIKLVDGETLEAKKIIVAVGGMSVPHTGSTGDGYPWAKAAGHTITDLYPTEVPITCSDAIIKNKTLQGLSLRNVELSVLDPEKGKIIKTHEGDMIFTHFGISGPIGLRCSQYVVKAKKKYKGSHVPLQLDLFPEESLEEVFQRLLGQLGEQSKKAIKNSISGFVPERLAPILLSQAAIDPSDVFVSIPHEKLRLLVSRMKGFYLTATGTLSIEKAFVTGGGVSVKEIHPKRMESKLMEGLFFCGEVLDLHGYTGGYNITVAFSTGYTAGQSAAWSL
ncbi:aminoacetone oxidase family FAD-binding enzyme [Salipaludibacillus neizhouensis]|uniref:Aminoacetone oxidase family FAD-binding enzyme n=1 Tax=Salipaludibacillus neizhouensis TaxID=885475 RepID=A0A3A9KQ38_9BACI|nr:NAD(P)/FAD-dependent oxidoreductase [Salipaludibacillus neizhouensis]RKL66796.1 aminoacetone oxidase family FAD-binding enzyme [Salipaludibacillus neizhouensis]